MAGDPDRLEGWKQIAAYLNKDLRTVQRWERSEGLPVHRHQHRAQGSVFAYPAELTEWARHRTTRPARAAVGPGAALPDPEPEPAPVAVAPPPAELAPEPAPPPAARRTTPGLLLIALAGAALLAAAGFVVQRRAAEPFSAFRQGGTALVGEFRNSTGNPLLDGTLPYLLGGELQRTGWVSVLARERVREAATSLGLPPDAPLTPRLIDSLRHRQPGVGVLITGQAEKAPAGYLVRIRLEDPATRRTLESPAIPAAHEGELPAAMHRLADWTRHALGDKRPGEDDPAAVPRPTTASAAAARLYSRAVALRLQGTPEEAAVQERLLREALREDPNFASAWYELSLAVRRQGRPREEWLPHLDKAYSLAATASVEERLQIEADRAMIRRDYAEAIAARRAYLQLNPDSPDALRKLILAYEWTGRYEEALSLALSHVTRQPENRVANYAASLGLANWAGDVARARPFADKAAALGAGVRHSAQPGYTWADQFPLFQLWAESRYADLARGIAPRAAAAQAAPPGPRRDNDLRFLGLFALGLGRTQEAAAIFAHLPEPRRQAAAALTAFLAGRPVPTFTAAHTYPDTGLTAVILARSGQLPAARAARAALESAQAGDGDLMAIDGEILAASNDPRAAAQLEEALIRLRLSGSPLYYLAAERLAQLHLAAGRPDAAVAALAEPVAARARAYNESGPGGAFWARDAQLLATLHRRQNRPREAAALESALRAAQPPGR